MVTSIFVNLIHGSYIWIQIADETKCFFANEAPSANETLLLVAKYDKLLHIIQQHLHHNMDSADEVN